MLQVFGCDIFLHRNEKKSGRGAEGGSRYQHKVGEAVIFNVALNKRGQPQATQVRKANIERFGLKQSFVDIAAGTANGTDGTAAKSKTTGSLMGQEAVDGDQVLKTPNSVHVQSLGHALKLRLQKRTQELKRQQQQLEAAADAKGSASQTHARNAGSSAASPAVPSTPPGDLPGKKRTRTMPVSLSGTVGLSALSKPPASPVENKGLPDRGTKAAPPSLNTAEKKGPAAKALPTQPQWSRVTDVLTDAASGKPYDRNLIKDKRLGRGSPDATRPFPVEIRNIPAEGSTKMPILPRNVCGALFAHWKEGGVKLNFGTGDADDRVGPVASCFVYDPIERQGPSPSRTGKLYVPPYTLDLMHTHIINGTVSNQFAIGFVNGEQMLFFPQPPFCTNACVSRPVHLS